jgi:hypothetical protein
LETTKNGLDYYGARDTHVVSWAVKHANVIERDYLGLMVY